MAFTTSFLLTKFASPELNFNIITGPNMGGKSIYIKQVALIQIMAQIGCFVPASSAVLRITDHIFSRIGFNDSIEYNASTYMLEMKEMKYIKQALTPTSLVIVDELCRGTSSEEGTSMAWAICEDLLQTSAFVFFTTHFMYLTRLQEVYYNVVNLHTEAIEESSDSSEEKKLLYLHKVSKGITNIDNYGLALARKTSMPEKVVQLAEELAAVILKYRKASVSSESCDNINSSLYALYADLKHSTRKRTKNEDSFTAIIDRFKQTHPDIVEAIRSEKSTSSDNPQTSDNNNSDSKNNSNNLTKINSTNISSDTIRLAEMQQQSFGRILSPNLASSSRSTKSDTCGDHNFPMLYDRDENNPFEEIETYQDYDDPVNDKGLFFNEHESDGGIDLSRFDINKANHSFNSRDTEILPSRCNIGSKLSYQLTPSQTTTQLNELLDTQSSALSSVDESLYYETLNEIVNDFDFAEKLSGESD